MLFATHDLQRGLEPVDTQEERARPSHDVHMKALISALLEHFMEAFFPEVHKDIDWGSTKQGVAEFPVGGTMKRPDMVFDSVLLGEPGHILIHIESQAQRQRLFPYRMLLYTASMAQQGLRVLPIAICSYRSPRKASAKVSGADDDTLEMTLPSGRILWYHFHRLDLTALNWATYVDHTENPAVAALLSRMEYREDEKGDVLRAFAHGILGLSRKGQGSDASNEMLSLVSIYFHSYFEISEDMERKVLDAMSLDAPQEERAYMNNLERYIAKGREEGLQQGQLQGQLQGTRKVLVRYLRTHFGSVTASAVAKLEAVVELEALESLSSSIFRASDMPEVERILSSATANDSPEGPGIQSD